MSDEAPRVARRSTRRMGLIVFSVAVAAGYGGWQLADRYARGVEAEVAADWDAELGTWDEMMDRFPARGPNASALETERLAAELGLRLAPKPVQLEDHVIETWANGVPASAFARDEPPVEPDRSAAVALDRIGEATFEWVHHELARAAGPISAAPDDVASHLDSIEPQLARLRRHLLHAETPRWERDLLAMFRSPVHDPSGHIGAQRLLVAAALHHDRMGRHDLAHESLVSAWRLTTDLRESLVMRSQMTALAGARYVTGAIRRLDRPYPDWVERLASHDPRSTMLAAMKYEEWVWQHVDERGRHGATRDASWMTRAWIGLSKPLSRLSFAETSAEMLARYGELEQSGVPCLAGGSSLAVELSSWNRSAMNVLLEFRESLLARAEQAALDGELTMLSLSVESSCPAGSASREPLPASTTLSSCTDVNVVLSVDASGETRMALDETPEWKPVGLELPTLIAWGHEQHETGSRCSTTLAKGPSVASASASSTDRSGRHRPHYRIVSGSSR